MKVYIYLFSLFFALNVYSQVQPKLNLSHLPKEEKLSYTIFYNWGVIWKKAGRGDFILHHANYKGNKCYEIDLYGRTLSWAESFFKVRDTLRAYCLEDGFIPQYYTKRVHEGKFDAVNEAFYSYSKNEIIIDLKNTRKDTLHHKGTLKSTLATYDMLSVFYFLRSIDLRKASKGDEFPVEVIGEKSIFHLKFRFLG
ncbi:MAG TPA: hypothetical protein DDY68_06155, partial [Porphyromonadaceae bacterium]|nr:hypothetical protein [Porphyromonadaceae bacterium]